jgi:hypothetical protein
MTEFAKSPDNLLVADICAGNTEILRLSHVHNLEKYLYRLWTSCKTLLVSLKGSPHSVPIFPVGPILEHNATSVHLTIQNCEIALRYIVELGVLLPSPGNKITKLKQKKETEPKNDEIPTLEELMSELPPFSRDK